MTEAARFRLVRYLRSRLGPLALLVVVVTCLSAPLAYFVLGRRALSLQARSIAQQVASVLQRDVSERPRLWRYDAINLVEHIHDYERQQGVAHIDVVTAAGTWVEASSDTLPDGVIWESAPLRIDKQVVGTVWVAAESQALRNNSIALLVTFTVLGCALGGLIYVFPIRAVGRAQNRISSLVDRLEDSQTALATLNQNLEHQIDERSTELRAAYETLQAKERNLRETSVRAVRLQETERRGIARELHDSAGQALTAIRINLQLMTQLLAGREGDAGLLELAQRTTSIVDGTVEEIRRAVNQLGPAVLDDVGLRDAIVRAADDFHETTGVEVDCEVELDAKLDASLESTCYRIVQESLTNVARYAEASRVVIRVRAGTEVQLQIRDDGKGFEMSERRHDSRGIIGMRERVELLGGQLTLNSRPGHGTSISVSIPDVEDA